MKIKIILFMLALSIPVSLLCDDSSSGPGGTFVAQFLDEGSALTRRSKVNWTGAGVVCVDNSILKRLDCTITTTGGGGGGSASFAVNYNNVLVSTPTSILNFMPPLIVTLQGSTSAQISLSAISLSTGVIGRVDISTQTNLAVTAPLILTNDTLSLSLVSLSTGIIGPLSVSSGTVPILYTSTLTFADGSIQTTAAASASGDITAVIAGTGLTGGALSGSATLSLDPAATNYIHNQNTLQSGATSYPGFLQVGTAGAIINGPLNATGIITASNTAITTAAGLLDATKLTGLVQNSSLDTSSVTKAGNAFNAAGQLLQLDGSAHVPDANLSANVSLLGSSIDISAETNLAAQSPLILSGDTITIDTTTLFSGAVISNQNSLQSGATFYVSSGTIDTGGLRDHGILDIDRPDLGTGPFTSRGRFKFDPNASSTYLDLYSYASVGPTIGWRIFNSAETQVGEWSFPIGTGASYEIYLASCATCTVKLRQQISKSGGISFKDNLAATVFQVNTGTSSVLGNFSVSGSMKLGAKTIAQLQALSPPEAGQVYFCSDCTVDGVVVSTGTSAGAFARISSRTTVIQ